MSVKRVPFNLISESRGDLVVLDSVSHAIFDVKRFFWVSGVPSGVIRGQHAHFECAQFLIAVSGKIEVSWDDGRLSGVEVLTPKSPGLFLPSLVWAEQRFQDSQSVLLVLCSEEYSELDYITHRESFLDIALRQSSGTGEPGE